MPKASKATASETVEVEGYEGHFEHFDGNYSVGFETYTADADIAPLFKGLPDDRCQCPHWGYVIKGKVTFTFADGHEETYETGDAYYAPTGAHPAPLRRLGGGRVQPQRRARAAPSRSSRRTWRRWAPGSPSLDDQDKPIPRRGHGLIHGQDDRHFGGRVRANAAAASTQRRRAAPRSPVGRRTPCPSWDGR